MTKTKQKSKADSEAKKTTFAYDKYDSGDIYIMALYNGEPYTDVTINPSSHGVTLKPNQILVSLPIMATLAFDLFGQSIVKSIVDVASYDSDEFGFVLELYDDWQERCKTFKHLGKNKLVLPSTK